MRPEYIVFILYLSFFSLILLFNNCYGQAIFGVLHILIVFFCGTIYLFTDGEGKNKRRLEEGRMNKINKTLSENHIHTIVILLISVVLCLALLSGCSNMSANKDSKIIGISLPTKSLERWNRDGIYLKEQFESQGYNVELRYSNDDVYQQNTLASYYSDGSRLDAVLVSNDAVALGASKAIQSDYKGSNFPIITGQDADIIAVHNIVDNIQAMTVFKNVNEEALRRQST